MDDTRFTSPPPPGWAQAQISSDAPHAQLMRYFKWEHLTTEQARDTSRECAELAQKMAVYLPDGPEKTAGLRKLLEAKDCFVRASFDLAGEA